MARNLCTSYLRIPSFLSQAETEALLVRSKQLLDSFDVENHPLVRRHRPCCNLIAGHLPHQTKFTTGEKDHVGDEYFLNSGDKMYVCFRMTRYVCYPLRQQPVFPGSRRRGQGREAHEGETKDGQQDWARSVRFH